jgi:hypothetical protein
MFPCGTKYASKSAANYSLLGDRFDCGIRAQQVLELPVQLGWVAVLQSIMAARSSMAGPGTKRRSTLPLESYSAISVSPSCRKLVTAVALTVFVTRRPRGS